MISCKSEKLEANEYQMERVSPEIPTMKSAATVRQRVGRSITRLQDRALRKVEEDTALVMNTTAPGGNCLDKRVNWLPDGARREIEEGALLLDDSQEIPLFDQMVWEEIQLKKQDIQMPEQQLMCQTMLLRYQGICMTVAFITMLVIFVIIYVKFAY